MKKTFYICCLLSLLGCGTKELDSQEKVIYGEDGISQQLGRRHNPWQSEFSSVALVTEKASLVSKRRRSFVRPKEEITSKICAKEPLKDAYSLGHCTGFLVDSDLLLTAKHCHDLITGGCENLAVIFDAIKRPSSSRMSSFPAKDVFSCKRTYFPKDPSMDLVLFELDRPTSRKALRLEQTDIWEKIGDLTVLGYPLGGSQKVSTGGRFRGRSGDDYRAELDVFIGNSGSPIFASDHTVRGVLVNGERDFEKTDEGCLKVKRCQTGDCMGEGFIPTKLAQSFIQQVQVFRNIQTQKRQIIFDQRLSQSSMIPTDPENQLERKFQVEKNTHIASIELVIDINHPRINDLLIYLIHPSGEILNLFNRETLAGSHHLLMLSSREPSSPLNRMLGKSSKGDWIVIIKDTQPMISGNLQSLSFVIEGLGSIEPSSAIETLH